MRDAIALTADLFTIVGVVTLVAFLMNHPVTKRLGVWAGAVRGADGYGWRRRQRTLRHWRRTAAEPLLSLLSRLGSETRQPLAPVTGRQPLPIDAPDAAALLAPYAPENEELRRRHEEQADREQRWCLKRPRASRCDAGGESTSASAVTDANEGSAMPC